MESRLTIRLHVAPRPLVALGTDVLAALGPARRIKSRHRRPVRPLKLDGGQRPIRRPPKALDDAVDRLRVALAIPTLRPALTRKSPLWRLSRPNRYPLHRRDTAFGDLTLTFSVNKETASSSASHRLLTLLAGLDRPALLPF